MIGSQVPLVPKRVLGKVEHREVLLSTGLYFAHLVSTVSQISWKWKIWRQVSLFHTKTCFLCFLWFFYKLSPDTRASNSFSTFVFLRFCFDFCIQTEEILLLFLLLITYEDGYFNMWPRGGSMKSKCRRFDIRWSLTMFLGSRGSWVYAGHVRKGPSWKNEFLVAWELGKVKIPWIFGHFARIFLLFPIVF